MTFAHAGPAERHATRHYQSVPLDAPLDAPPLYWRRGDEDDPNVLGRSTDALFILDDAGTVWLVPEGAELPRLFVNSSTNRFYESMAVFQSAWGSLGPDEDATFGAGKAPLDVLIRTSLQRALNRAAAGGGDKSLDREKRLCT